MNKKKFIIISIILLFIRFSFFSYISPDMKEFLIPWFNEIKINGGFNNFINYPGNYNIIYMFILTIFTYIPVNCVIQIKVLSVIFDILLSLIIYKIVYYITKDINKSRLCFLIIFGLPQVIINSSLWGQCDSIYTFFIFLALYYLLKNKDIKALIALGISFSFKLQFIFILPLFIIYIFTNKKNIFKLLIIPLINYLIALIPFLLGKKDAFFIYFNQIGESSRLQTNSLNIFNFNINEWIGLFLAFLFCLYVLIFIINKKIKLNNEKILYLGFTFILIITFLLPGMHERYIYSGEILLTLYFLLYNKYKYLMIYLNFTILICYFFAITNNIGDFRVLSLIYMIFLLNYLKNFEKTLVKD